MTRSGTFIGIEYIIMREKKEILFYKYEINIM